MTKKLTKVAMTTALAAAAIVPAVVATPAQAAEAEVAFAKAYYTTANGTAAFTAGELGGIIAATNDTKVTYVEASNGEVFDMTTFSEYFAAFPTATTNEVLTALSTAGKALSADQVKALDVKEGKVEGGKVTVDPTAVQKTALNEAIAKAEASPKAAELKDAIAAAKAVAAKADATQAEVDAAVKALNEAIAKAETATELKVESVKAINNTLIQVTFNKDVTDVKASNITLSAGTVEGVTVSGNVASIKVKGLNFGQEVTVGVNGVTGVADHSQTVKVPTVNELYTLDIISDQDTVKSDGLSKTMITVTLKEKATGETVKTDAVVQFTTTRGALAQPEVSFQNGSASVQLTSVASPTSVPAIVTAVIAEAPDAAQYIGLTNQKNITFSPDAITDGTVTFVQAVGVQARQGDRLQVDFSGDITAEAYKKAVLGNSTGTWAALATAPAGTSANITINDKVVRVKDVRNVTPRTLEFILDTDTTGSVAPAPATKRIEAGWINADSTAKNFLRDNVEHTLKFPADLGNLVRKNDGLKFVMADTSKPRVFGVEAKNQMQFDVRFSEAMAEDLVEGGHGQVNPDFKIDGQAVVLYATAEPTAAQIVTAKAANQIIVTELKVGSYDVAKAEDTRNIVSFKVHKDFKLAPGAHTVQVSNVGDWAGLVDAPANIVTTQTFDFTVVADTNAPAPTVVSQSPEQWLVTFDRKAESVTGKLAQDAFVIHTAAGYAKNPKEALVMGTDFDVYSIDKNGFAGTLLQPTDRVTAHDNFLIEFKSDWTQKLLSETTNVGYWHSTLNPFKLTFDNLESEYGVKMAAQVKDVTLTYDGVSPEISSAVDIDTLDKKTGNGVTVTGSGQKVLVKMSEPVQMPASTNRTPSQQQQAGAGIPEPTFEFVKGDKVVKGSYEALALDDQSFVVKPETTLEAGEWTLYIRSISDDVGNTSATVSKTVTVPQTQATVTDTKIAWAGFDNNAGTSASDYDYVYIKFTKEMKSGGANGVAATTNYVFQGNELPAGSEVLKGIKGVTNDWDGVTLRMPHGTWNGLSGNTDFASIVSVANNFEAADGEKLSTPYAVEMKDTVNDAPFVNNDMKFEAFYGAYSATGALTRDAGIVVDKNVYPVIAATVADTGIETNADGKKVIKTINLTLPVATTGTFVAGQEVLVNGKTYTVSHTSGTATATLTAKTAADRVEGTATSALKITAKNGAIIVNTGLVVDSATPVIETAKFNDDKTKITVTFSEAVTNSDAGFFEKLVTTDFDLTGLTGTPTVTAIEHNESTANQVVLTLNAAATSALVSETITVSSAQVYDFAKNAALTTGTANITGALLAGPAAPTGLTATSPTTVGGNDGKITGIVAGLEYKLDSATTWIQVTPAQVTAGEVTGLAAGDYDVRVEQTATQAASAVTTVMVTPSVLAGITGNAVTTQGVAPVTEVDATVGGLTFKLGTDLDGYKIKLGTIDDGTAASATVDPTTKVITLNGDFDNTDTNGNFISASDAKSAIETATLKTLTSVTGTAVATATAAESVVYVAPVTGGTEKVEITITGTASSAGTLTVVAGTKTYNITVANGATQNDVAAAIHTAINADVPAGYTSSVATNVVTLTSTTLNDNVTDLAVTIN